MNKIKGNFFEEHIEKIVLIVFCVLCMAILISRVLLSPNSIRYNGSKFSPAKIDEPISKKAKTLDMILNEAPTQKEPYSPRIGEFTALIDTSVNIDVSRDFDLPMMSDRQIDDDRKYDLPSIGSIVANAMAERIRAVAYVPTEKITLETPYSAGNTEPNDIDFVTVQAELNMNRLYDSFNEAFAGSDVSTAWRDPCFAEPVFAAVDLQRQEINTDGSLSGWQRVERTNIDDFKEILQIIEDVKNLPDGGMKVRMLQFDNRNIQKALLQPQPYNIASSDDAWLPPALHQEYVKIQKEEKNRIERAARDAEALERAKKEEERRRLRQERLSRNSTNTLRRDELTEVDSAISERRQKALEARELARNRNNPVSDETSDEENISPFETFMEKVNVLMITPETNFRQMNTPLLFWAHDDTVEPGKNYQYRIRVGFFNPLAGSDMLKEKDESQKKQVILWSDFAYSPQTIKIPQRSYFFAHDMIEAADAVKVEICKYILGYWRSENFTVKPGEPIGAPVERNILNEEQGVMVPQTIDYATGYVLIDMVAVNEWSDGRKIQPIRYYQMIYSKDGKELEYQPIKKTYWSDVVRNNFNMIREKQKETPKPLRGWGDSKLLRQGLEFQNNPDDDS